VRQLLSKYGWLSGRLCALFSGAALHRRLALVVEKALLGLANAWRKSAPLGH
jgi:hypothetical protein